MRRLSTVMIVGVMLPGLLALAGMVREASSDHPGTQGSQRRTRGVCRGFVVLPNGFAVLSGVAGAHHGHSHPGHMAQSPGAPQHLLGYAHGQELVLQDGMLCVPIGGVEAQAWTAVSQEAGLSVKAESLYGVLAHNSRTNEAFILTLRDGDKPIEQSQVRLLVRMPHHDRQTPGGHGPANDPDVQGLVAQELGQGRYRVPTVDFTMPGPWLFEVQVGFNRHKAYFAASVGEE